LEYVLATILAPGSYDSWRIFRIMGAFVEVSRRS
jgi:hypothetical protein